jgi:membrane protease YdiL (CAAX protease family)
MNHPVLLLCLTLGGWYVARLWWTDTRAARAGKLAPGALPGSTSAPMRAVVIGAVGAVALVALETAGELALGIAAEQSRMTWLFALYSITAASVIEELIFRGYVVVADRGRGMLVASIIGASALFALAHPFLWAWEEGTLRPVFTAKAVFSTTLAFVASLWFYAVRFGPWNPQRSLLPCFVAHAVKNTAVVAVKAASGFMVGLW